MFRITTRRVRFLSSPRRTCLTARILVALTAVTLLAPAVVAATIPAEDARIVKVTVYRDRAEVVERAVVQLPAGSSTIEFGGIPIGVESDSLRVAAEGVPATLGTVEIRELVQEPAETDEWKAAQDEVRRLERELAMLDEGDAVDQELFKFLQAMGKVTAERSAKETGGARADPEAMNGIYDMLQSRLRGLAESKLEREEQRREIQDEYVLAKARLRTLRPAASIRSRVAAVAVESSSAGRLTVRLSYLVPGASWRPTYRATLDAESGEVALVAEGVVRQSTGQDWSGVELHLSSASPAVGVEPPMLVTWFLRPLRLQAQGGYLEERVTVRADVASRARPYQNVAELAPGLAEPAPMPATSIETEIVRSAYNVAFRVPGSSDVPADGTDHRMVLRQETLKTNLVHRTVPGTDDRAFLTGVMTSPEAYPLLAGPMRVFTGGAYLGSFPLKETGPGVELTIPFGVDNRIEVLRVPEPEMKSREGWTGKQKQVHKTERTIVTNLMDRAATLVLEDRLPVSEDERIVVQIGDATTPGYRDSERRPGVKLWTIELAPGEKREIVLDYTVRYPREIHLPGLE